MELTWDTKGSASNGTTALRGHTTSVVTNVIDIVLLTLLLKLSKARLSVTTTSGCGNWDVT